MRPLSNMGGFTLLEMMISLSILAGITTVVASVFRNSAEVQAEMSARAELSSIGRVAIERMRREISLAFISESENPEAFKTMFTGEDRDPFDQLTFTSLSHTPLYRNTKECDQTEISYTDRADPDSSLSLLMHRESRRIDEDPEKGGMEHVLAYRVKSLNLRYFDDWDREEWVDEWDTEASETRGKLPRMVEIQLVLVDDEGFEHPFFTRTQIASRNH